MHRQIFCVIAFAAAFPLSAATVNIRPELTRTFNNPNQANIFHEPDGGYRDSAHGWFYKAEVMQSATGPAYVYCYYELDKAFPSNRPAYSVHYPLTGFSMKGCTVSGATVNCSHITRTVKP